MTPTEKALVVTAIATGLYGFATLCLVIQMWRDRVQREKHFREQTKTRLISELFSAFCEAWGYWKGFLHGSDVAQSGKMFEALVRFECQLRLNGYTLEANNLGLAIRTDMEVGKPLTEAGVALGLLPCLYDFKLL